MKIKFQHIFPGKILQLQYFGTREAPKIWVDCELNKAKQWFIVDLMNGAISQTINPFLEDQIYTWIGSSNELSYFSIQYQGKNPKAEEYVSIDITTGKIMEKTSVFSSKINFQNNDSFELETPLHYHESSPHFVTFKEFFLKKFKEEIGKGIDYLEGINKLIFSYYLYENTWVNKLKVCNLSFDTLWEDTLDMNDLIGHTTFQVINQQLVYTKNKNELIILSNE